MTENQQNQENAQFGIQRIYVKDLSFEAPGAPAIFTKEWKPELSVDVDSTYNNLGEENYEVILSVHVTAKSSNEAAFIVEIKQAGIFSIKNLAGDALDHALGSFCPNILFPYAREVISSQVVGGSFPQLILAPVNFDALYEQKKKSKTETA